MRVVAGLDLAVDAGVELGEPVDQGHRAAVAAGDVDPAEAAVDRPGQLPGHGAVVVGEDGHAQTRWRGAGPARSSRSFAIENETSGGSRLTDVNELAASPSNCPSTSAATATTPVGKMPNDARSASRIEVLVGREDGRGHDAAGAGALAPNGTAARTLRAGAGCCQSPRRSSSGSTPFAEVVRLLQVRIAGEDELGDPERRRTPRSGRRPADANRPARCPPRRGPARRRPTGSGRSRGRPWCRRSGRASAAVPRTRCAAARPGRRRIWSSEMPASSRSRLGPRLLGGVARDRVQPDAVSAVRGPARSARSRTRRSSAATAAGGSPQVR